MQMHEDRDTLLCFNHMKENNGPAVNEAGSLQAAIMLRASPFVLSCEREMCMHSPYSM